MQAFESRQDAGTTGTVGFDTEPETTREVQVRAVGERGLLVHDVTREEYATAVAVSVESDYIHPALGFAVGSPNGLADWQRGLLDYYGDALEAL